MKPITKTFILLACALRASAFAPSPEPESGTLLFSATGLFTGSQPGSFVMQETKNVIAFTDRPKRVAMSTTLETVAGLFDAEATHIPPNAVLTITAQGCTQDENVFSIPVTLTSHTYFANDPDKMAFTYTLLGNVTAQESEALSSCQACPLAIFVDSMGYPDCDYFECFRDRTWSMPYIEGINRERSPYQHCCTDGAKFGEHECSGCPFCKKLPSIGQNCPGFPNAGSYGWPSNAPSLNRPSKWYVPYPKA